MAVALGWSGVQAVRRATPHALDEDGDERSAAGRAVCGVSRDAALRADDRYGSRAAGRFVATVDADDVQRLHGPKIHHVPLHDFHNFV